MDSFSWFIIAILGLLALAGAHRRYIKYRIIKMLLDDEATPDEIKKIMQAYKEE